MLGLIHRKGDRGGPATAARSSIGRKVLLGVTGLLLCGFLFTHLAGNLLILKGEGAFNQYAYALESNPLIVPAEVGLALIFLMHIGLAIVLTRQNRMARPTPYVAYNSKGGRTVASNTMIYTGLITLVFLVVHLWNFRLQKDAHESLYQLVIDTLGNPLYAVFYTACCCVLGLHLCHGLQSACRSLGLVHPRYTPLVTKVSCAFGFLMAAGFSLLAVVCCIRGMG